MSKKEFPRWFNEFLDFYLRPEKPTIRLAFDQFLFSSPHLNEKITYARTVRMLAVWRAQQMAQKVGTA